MNTREMADCYSRLAPNNKQTHLSEGVAVRRVDVSEVGGGQLQSGDFVGLGVTEGHQHVELIAADADLPPATRRQPECAFECVRERRPRLYLLTCAPSPSDCASLSDTPRSESDPFSPSCCPTLRSSPGWLPEPPQGCRRTGGSWEQRWVSPPRL